MDQVRKKSLMKPVLLIVASSALYIGLLFFNSEPKTDVLPSEDIPIMKNIPTAQSQPIQSNIVISEVKVIPGTIDSLPNPFSPLPTGNNVNPVVSIPSPPPIPNLGGLNGGIHGGLPITSIDRVVLKAIFYGGNSVAIIGNSNEEVMVSAGEETKWGTVSEIHSDSIVMDGKRFRLQDSESIDVSSPGTVAPIPSLPIIGRNGGI